MAYTGIARTRDLVHEVPIQDPTGASGGACARPDPPDLSRARCGDCAGSGVAGSHSLAVISSASSVTGQDCPVHQAALQPTSAGGISRIAKTILGTAHVDGWVLLCDGGRRGRGNDQGLYREPEMRRRRSGLQDHRAERALSRATSNGFSRTPATFGRR